MLLVCCFLLLAPQVPSQRVLVIADDLDQPPAAVRLRQKGGHGGHNGLRSIIQRLGGTQDFPRLKIGELGSTVCVCRCCAKPLCCRVVNQEYLAKVPAVLV